MRVKDLDVADGVCEVGRRDALVVAYGQALRARRPGDTLERVARVRGLQVEEGCRGIVLAWVRWSIHLRDPRRLPQREAGLKLVLILVVTDTHVQDLGGAKRRELFLIVLTGRAEMAVGAVAKSKDGEVHAGETTRFSAAELLIESRGILRDLALTAGCDHDDDILPAGQVLHRKVVQLGKLNSVSTRLALASKARRQLLSVPGLAAIQDAEGLTLLLVGGGHLRQVPFLPPADRGTHGLYQLLEGLRFRPVQALEPVLRLQVCVQVLPERLLIQLHGDLPPGVEAVEWPVATGDGHLLTVDHLPQAVRMHDLELNARGVGKDHRGPVVLLCLRKRLDSLRHVCAHGDGGHVHIAVRHAYLSQILLLALLAAHGKLRHAAPWRGLALLAACVAVGLGVQHDDVNIHTAGNHVVQASESDIVRPAVAADNPLRGLDEHVLVVVHIVEAHAVGARLLCFLEQGRDLILEHVACACRLPLLVPLVQSAAKLRYSINLGRLQEIPNVLVQLLTALLRALGHAEAKLRVILKQRVLPRRPLPVRVPDSVWRAAVWIAPDGGTPCSIGDHHSVPEHLSHQLHIRSLSTARARSRELEQRLLHLRALHRVNLHEVFPHRQRAEEVPVLLVLQIHRLRLGHHSEGIVRTGLHAHLAASAICC
mmetsp:Transcript_91488/g.267684  ORF Transcript_91488/g.267684 Transcript_91488/m.267684 type:complete len:654 (-) Transcript_91488:2723-4684(-)